MAKRISRRNFMASATAGTASLFGINPPIAALAQSSDSTAEDPGQKPIGSQTALNSMCVRLHAKFTELPLTSIQPQGWLRAFMIKAKDGLTGRQ